MRSNQPKETSGKHSRDRAQHMQRPGGGKTGVLATESGTGAGADYEYIMLRAPVTFILKAMDRH